MKSRSNGAEIKENKRKEKRNSMNIRRSFGTRKSQLESVIFYKQVQKDSKKQVSVRICFKGRKISYLIKILLFIFCRRCNLCLYSHFVPLDVMKLFEINCRVVFWLRIDWFLLISGCVSRRVYSWLVNSCTFSKVELGFESAECYRSCTKIFQHIKAQGVFFVPDKHWQMRELSIFQGNRIHELRDI